MRKEQTQIMRKSKSPNQIVNYLKNTGSTWMPLDKENVDKVDNSNLITQEKDGEKYITFRKLAQIEKEIAEALYVRTLNYIEVDHENIDLVIDEFERKKSSELNITFCFCDEQRNAIHMMVSCQIGILTGGPGTGKTTVIECIYYVLQRISEAKKFRVKFTAPTGKAASRITESTGFPASTLVSYTGGFQNSKIKYNNPHVLFIDESSMCDIYVIHNLIKSVLPSTRIIFVGDIDQLLSVDIGAVLRDMILSECFPVAMLKQTFRQKGDTEISQNIQLVKQGVFRELIQGETFEIYEPTDEDMMELIIKKYIEGVEKFGKEKAVLLTPTKRSGKFCSNVLNNKLQNILNPSSDYQPSYAVIKNDGGLKISYDLREGDLVLNTRNNDKVTNGDVGIIKKIDNHFEHTSISVEFWNQMVVYTDDSIKDLELAYALTVCKSQGSEYPFVLMLALPEHKNLNRNLIYTGISRAKKKCIIIGNKELISDSCKKIESEDRTTFLKEELLAQKMSWILKVRTAYADLVY